MPAYWFTPTPLDMLRVRARVLMPCPYCKAVVGQRCVRPGGRPYSRYVHDDRYMPLVTIWAEGRRAGVLSERAKQGVPNSGQGVA